MLINFFIFLTMLFLFCGLALDAGMLQLRKLQLQHAADAAALGALMERSRGNSGWVAAGKSDAALNGFTDGSNGVTITIQSPPTSGTYSGDSSAVQAIVSQNVHPGFMALVGGGTATPGSTSVAKTSANPDCFYLMGGSSLTYSINVNGLQSITSACNIYVDTTRKSLEVLLFGSLSVTNSKVIKVQGTSSSTFIFGSVSPSPTYNSPNETDPLSYVTAPTFSSCNYTNYNANLTTATINPGTYCGGITINASTVTFNPGLYIVVGGINWGLGSTIKGSGVTIYLTKGGAWNTYSNLNIVNSNVTLSAPTSTAGGGITGVLFFADRNWSNSGGQNFFFTNVTINSDGIWYLPNIGINHNIGSFTAPNYLGIICDNYFLNAGSLTIPSPDFSSLSGGSPFRNSNSGGLVQ